MEEHETRQNSGSSASRRDFLNGVARLVGAGTVTAGVGAAYLRAAPENERIVRENGVTRIDGEDARHSILYGSHLLEQKNDALTADIDGLYLETGTYAYWEHDDSISSLSKHPQYASIIPKAKRNKIPIYLADAGISPPVYALDIIPRSLEVGASYIGLNKQAKIDAERDLTPTDHFRRGAVYAGAGFLTLPTASYPVTISASLFGVGKNQISEFYKAVERTHPELALYKNPLRNSLVAEKLYYVTKEEFGKETPHFAEVWGAEHSGFEDHLQYTSERRMNFLRDRKELIVPAYPSESVHLIQKYDFVNSGRYGSWELTDEYSIPRLNELLE